MFSIGNTTALEELNLSNWDFRNYKYYGFSGSSTEYVNIKSAFSLDYCGVQKLILDGAIFPTNMTNAFSDIYSLKEISFEDVDTSEVTNMEGMFTADSGLTYLDVNSFDTSNVTNMKNMFSSCSNLTGIDLDNFDTSNVETMLGMFKGDQKLTSLDLSHFNIRNAKDLRLMFVGNSKLQHLNLSNWDFTNYQPGSMGFTDSFGDYESLMRHLSGNTAEIPLLNTLIMDNVIFPSSLNEAFYDLSNLEHISLKNVDTSNTTNMRYLFLGDKKIKTLDLSSFDTSKVTNMRQMFQDMNELTTIIVSDKFVVDQVTESSAMFVNCNNLVGEQGTAYSQDHQDKEYARVDSSSNPGYFTKNDITINTITFNANGGHVTTSYINVLKNNEIGTLPEPTRDGYTFDGWYTGLTDGVKVDETYTPTGNVILYARWR